MTVLMRLRQWLQQVCHIPAGRARRPPTENEGSVKHYTYRVEWSPEDGEWVALCVEFPSLSWLEASPTEAFAGMLRLVGEVIADMEASREDPPQPLAERERPM
jgi:predicted RNase H-like HicB family nuclease